MPPPVTAKTTFRWMSDLSEIALLKDAWEALEASSPDREIFSTFEWRLACYANYRELWGRPLVGTAWEGDRLVGVAPMCIWKGTIGGLPVRRLDFSGHQWVQGSFLLADGYEHLKTDLVREMLRSPSWDVISLFCDPEGSDCFGNLRALAKERHWSFFWAPHHHTVVEMPDGYNAYLKRLSGDFRRNLRNRERRMEAAGGFRVERITRGASEENVVAALERCFEIERRGSRNRGVGPIAEVHNRFYRDTYARYAHKGIADISILTIGGKDAAFILGLVERGIFYDGTIGYAEEYRKFSPGTVLMQHVLRSLDAAGIHRVVSHGPYPYKDHWTTARVPRSRVFLFRPNLRGKLAYLLKVRIAPALKRMRSRPPAPVEP